MLQTINIFNSHLRFYSLSDTPRGDENTEENREKSPTSLSLPSSSRRQTNRQKNKYTVCEQVLSDLEKNKQQKESKSMR